MVDTQHFCLRWNNYQSSITSAFENLRDDEDFVDVTLACDGKSLKAHRVVLSACSPYFRELLKSTPCKHPVIVLQDVAWTDLHALVEFIYHGEVNVHQRSLSSFLKTAEVLRVSGLTQQQHGDDRDQLTQVQMPSRQQTPTSNHHHHHHLHHPLGVFPEKLVEDTLFTSPTSPPHNVMLNRDRKAPYRRDRRMSIDPESEHKRARSDQHIHIGNNNNNELNLSTHQPPPQTQPADFSPSTMKVNPLNLNTTSILKPDVEGNGISSTENESRPCSPSPTSNNTTSRVSDDPIKSEPMELLCPGSAGINQEDNSNDSDAPNDNGPSNLPQGPHSGSSGGDHDDHDSPIGPYLTPTESKLFPGSFNFSMAALAADPTGLGVQQKAHSTTRTMKEITSNFLNNVARAQNKMYLYQSKLPPLPQSHMVDGLNQSLTNADSLAGTSQGGVDEFRCQPCNKSLSSLTRLKRHIQNVHMRPSREPVCNICKRVYSSLNSLRNHKSIYHRNVKNIKSEDVIPPHSFYL